MQLLKLEDDLRAYPAPEVADIPEFRALVKRDKGSPGDSQGRKKQRAARELAYIYHMSSYESPYRVYEEDLRRDLLQKDVFHDMPEWKEDKLVREALSKYEELSQSEMTLLLGAAISAVNKLKSYFNGINFADVDEQGRPLHTAKDVVSNLANLGKVVEGVQKLKEQVEKDQLGSNTNRRSVKTNKFSE